METRVCSACNETKPKEDFYKHNAKCKQCIKARVKKRVTKNRQWIINHLLNNPCVDCGETNPIVLEFDHVIPGNKSHKISYLRKSSNIATIKKEVEKCEVRCANCHRRRHAAEDGWFGEYDQKSWNKSKEHHTVSLNIVR